MFVIVQSNDKLALAQVMTITWDTDDSFYDAYFSSGAQFTNMD